MRTTIREVAKRAGVGIGTVSRALNGDPRVRPETRQRVLEVVAELGYVPDQAARALRSGRTHTIAAVVPSFSKNFYIEILRGIEVACRSNGLALIILNADSVEEAKRFISPDPLRGQADGLLVVSLTPDDEQFASAQRSSFPVILIDSCHESLDAVVVDHFKGGSVATAHLLDRGHTKIALIDHPQNPFVPVVDGGRQSGYRSALLAADIAPLPELMLIGDYSQESGYRLMSGLLMLSEPPTAVFAGSDLQAIGAMQAIRESGLRVGKDIAVVGYNDIELAEYLGLTTVRIPSVAMGEQAVSLLVDRLSQPSSEPRRVCLDVSLIVRKSS